MAKYESQQWAEIGLGLKQYHKGRSLGLNHKDYMGANYGPTSQLRAKKNKMGNFGLFLWATFSFFFFFYFFFFFLKTKNSSEWWSAAARGGS
jgi:hypothetical protein